jgi:serine/threonine-protein kinase
MLRLRTLGGLTIEDENGPRAGAIARKRSLALLALVGLGTEQGVSRDRVLAYLWPESEADRARTNLKQTLFQLRQDLHEEVFARAAGVLRLEPGAISVDACDFQAALDRGNPTTAVTLYRGPFLDGFFLPGLAEFERWVESERVRLAQRYAGALETLAVTAAGMGDHHGASDWWRRLAALDPLSARYVVGLMRSLAQSGDRAAALEHARVYEELVRGEFDSDPDPEVTDLAKQLRGMFARWTSPAPRPPTGNPVAGETGEAPIVQAPPAAPVPAGDVTPAQSPPAPPRKSPVPGVVSRPAPNRSPRFRMRSWLALGGLLLAGAWWWARHHEPSRGSPDLVAVFPFTFSGADESRYLASGMVDLLSASLDGAGRLRSVHPSVHLARMVDRAGGALDPERGRSLARQLGAELYVLGQIVATGTRVLIGAAMYDRSRKEAVAQASVEGEAGEVFELVGRLAAGLIASRYGEPRERLSRVAATATRSLPAFKAYLDGERAYNDGHDVEAIEAFQRALAADTTFALAYYRLSDAADRAGRPELAQTAAERALRFRDRLGERERRLIEAQHAWRMGRVDEAEGLCRALIADYPDDVEALLLLGEVLAHGNPVRGRSSVEARPAFEQVLARDPRNGEAVIHLARIASIEGRRQAVDSLVRLVLAVGGGSEVVETRAFRAFVLGDRPGQKRVTRRILANPGGVPVVTALEVAVTADGLEGTERFGRWLAGASQAPDLRGYGHRMLAQAALARGQWSRARTELDVAARFDSIPALELRSLFAALSFVPLPRAEVLATRDLVRRWHADPEPGDLTGHTTAHSGLHRYLRLHRLGLLDARLGDTVMALRQARALDRARDTTLAGRLAHTLAQSIRAHVAAAGGRDAEALGDIETAGWEAAASVFVSEAYDRYFRAELLQRLARTDEALGWYGSIAERAAYELVYLAPSHRRQAEIYVLRGQRDSAAVHYRRFIELWSGADPELQPAVSEARRRVEELEGENKGVNSKQ